MEMEMMSDELQVLTALFVALVASLIFYFGYRLGRDDLENNKELEQIIADGKRCDLKLAELIKEAHTLKENNEH